MKKKVARRAVTKPKPKPKPVALVRRPAAPKRVRAERVESTSLAGLSPAVGMSVLGMSAANLTASQREQLTALIPDEMIELLPSGECYSPHAFIRQRFNDVFGVGQWAIADDPPQTKGDNLVVRCTMLVNGRPVAYAYGESRYIEANKRHSWGKALESAKSNAIMRCAKDLGVGIKQFWSRRWQFQYRMKHGVYVKVHGRNGVESQWRHIDSPPYEGEQGIDPTSPNQERYVMPSAARRAAASSYQPRTDKDDDAADAAELRASTQALVPASQDGPIDTEARKHLFGALKTHGRTEADLRAFIKAEWGYDSTKLIKRSQFATVKKWIQDPWDADGVVDGEIRR